MKFKSKKNKPRSKNQQWASERNWNKASLIGVKSQILRVSKSKSTCPLEKDILSYAYIHICEVLDSWDSMKDTSKEYYLKG